MFVLRYHRPMGYVDILIYAAVAAFILMRLWMVLGRRDDDEPQRPNPFAMPPQDEEDVMVRPERARELPAPISLPTGLAPASLAGGLAQIATLDPTFNEKQFLQGAKNAFRMIVTEFAKGELTQSENVLAPSVREQFRKAIADRTMAGHVMENRILDIKDVDISAARVENTHAFLTVHFISHQINVTRDMKNGVVHGDADQAEEVDDVWVFSRDLKANDPNWQLVETKS